MATGKPVGIADVAYLAGVSMQAVCDWRLRYDHFPHPIQNLQSKAIWDRERALDWVKRLRGDEAHALSFLNLKAGVDKTKRTLAVAERLVQGQRKHVLLIDSAPQTNATVALVPEEKWTGMDERLDKLLSSLPRPRRSTFARPLAQDARSTMPDVHTESPPRGEADVGSWLHDRPIAAIHGLARAQEIDSVHRTSKGKEGESSGIPSARVCRRASPAVSRSSAARPSKQRTAPA